MGSWSTIRSPHSLFQPFLNCGRFPPHTITSSNVVWNDPYHPTIVFYVVRIIKGMKTASPCPFGGGHISITIKRIDVGLLKSSGCRRILIRWIGDCSVRRTQLGNGIFNCKHNMLCYCSLHIVAIRNFDKDLQGFDFLWQKFFNSAGPASSPFMSRTVWSLVVGLAVSSIISYSIITWKSSFKSVKYTLTGHALKFSWLGHALKFSWLICIQVHGSHVLAKRHNTRSILSFINFVNFIVAIVPYPCRRFITIHIQSFGRFGRMRFNFDFCHRKCMFPLVPMFPCDKLRMFMIW